MLEVSKEIPDDKRSNARVLVSLPVFAEGRLGTTRDVSVSGLYFEIDESSLPGSELELSVDLLHVKPKGVVRMICKARIVRVERRDGKLGVAVSIDTHNLLTVESPQ